MVLEVKNLPANAGDIRDTGSIPGSERSLEKGMAIYFSVLAWRFSCSLTGYSPWGHKERNTTEATQHTHIYVCITAINLKLTQHCKLTILQFKKCESKMCIREVLWYGKIENN